MPARWRPTSKRRASKSDRLSRLANGSLSSWTTTARCAKSNLILGRRRRMPALRLCWTGSSQQPNLDITVISGRSQEDLEAFLGGYPFRLIAEHGASLAGTRQEGMGTIGSQHQLRLERGAPGRSCDFTNRQLRAARSRRNILRSFGTIGRADEEFGAWKANQLTEELSALTANHPIKVRHGKKMVEVTAAENNKGAAVARVLEQNDELRSRPLCRR